MAKLRVVQHAPSLVASHAVWQAMDDRRIVEQRTEGDVEMGDRNQPSCTVGQSNPALVEKTKEDEQEDDPTENQISGEWTSV